MSSAHKLNIYGVSNKSLELRFSGGTNINKYQDKLFFSHFEYF